MDTAGDLKSESERIAATVQRFRETGFSVEEAADGAILFSRAAWSASGHEWDTRTEPRWGNRTAQVEFCRRCGEKREDASVVCREEKKARACPIPASGAEPDTSALPVIADAPEPDGRELPRVGES